MDGNATFNGNGLNTFDHATATGVVLDNIDLDNLPTKMLSLFGLAHSNNSAIPNSNEQSKIIPITGTASASSPAELDALLDTYKGYLTGIQKNLDIPYGTGVRRFTATITGNSKIKRSANKKMARIELEFICTPPYGIDTTATIAVSQTGRTASAYTDTHVFKGNAEAQLPVFTITLTAVSSTGSQQLFLGNGNTGQTLMVTRTTWTSGDVVIIDCRDGGSVTVNGNPVDFSGAFPEFAPGSHSIIYGDSFTSRTMTEHVEYNARYM